MENYVQPNGNLAHVTYCLLLDTRSELSYVSERCIQALGLTRSAPRILVTGISSDKAATTRGTLDIKPLISDVRLVVYAHVLGRITSSLDPKTLTHRHSTFLRICSRRIHISTQTHQLLSFGKRTSMVSAYRTKDVRQQG